VDELKIDRTFVQHMCSNDSDLTIVRSTIDLAHALGLQVVAEGVEDGLTWERLRRVGCDQGQGYYLGRPVAAQELVEWLGQSRADVPGGMAA
jgi:EAL domain-containing protein (putative c-di-GMP-specific phosphodiesterase class I)